MFRMMGFRVLIVIAMLHCGCSSMIGGSGSGTSQNGINPTSTPVPDDNFNFFIDLQSGTMVGKLETENPPASMPQFTLYGTLPIPRFGFPTVDGSIPFAVKDLDGTLQPAQVNIVTRYPKTADGADVVEIVARVHRDDTKATGAAVAYEVQYSPYMFGVQANTASPAEFLGSTPGLPGIMVGMLQDPNALLLVAEDVDGNRYEANLLRGQEGSRAGDFGPWSATYRTTEVMRLTQHGSNPQSGCASLPHLFTATSYFKTLANEPVLKLDLRLSNGWSDKSGSTLDDQLGGVFVKYIHLYVKKSMNAVQEPADPSFKNQNLQSTATHEIVELVKARSDGALIYIPHRAQFHRRLAIMQQGSEPLATNLLQHYGLAYATAGVNSAGVKLFSWENPLTGRFGPGHIRATSMAHIRTTLRNQYTNSLGSASQSNSLLSSAINGLKSTGGIWDTSTTPPKWKPAPDPFKYDHLDAVTPYWGEYGGFTGGTKIVQNPGSGALAAASRNAYRVHEITNRYIQNRQYTAYYNLDGEPVSLEQTLVNGKVNYTFFDGVTSGDPFKDNSIDSCQKSYVKSAGLDPVYDLPLQNYNASHESVILDAFKKIDAQHLIRLMVDMVVLVWLGNDAVSKDDFIREAEVAQMNFHQYMHVNGSAVPNSLLDLLNKALINPHQASAWGRDEAWITYALSAGYSIGDDSFRARKKDYFDNLVDLAEATQMDCSAVYDGGFMIKKAATAKFPAAWVNKYYAAQAWEEDLLRNAFSAAIESVYRNFDLTNMQRLNEVIRRSANAESSDLHLLPNHGPQPQIVLGYQPTASQWPGSFQPFCQISDVEPAPNDDWNTGKVENYYSPHAFGLNYIRTGDMTYLNKIAWVKSAASLQALENSLMNNGNSNLENNTALLAAVRSALGTE